MLIRPDVSRRAHELAPVAAITDIDDASASATRRAIDVADLDPHDVADQSPTALVGADDRPGHAFGQRQRLSILGVGYQHHLGTEIWIKLSVAEDGIVAIAAGHHDVLAELVVIAGRIELD